MKFYLILFILGVSIIYYTVKTTREYKELKRKTAFSITEHDWQKILLN